MDIKRTQATSDRSVNSSREIAPFRASQHVRFEEVEQAKPTPEIQDKRSPDIERQQIVQEDKKSASDDNIPDASKFFAVTAGDDNRSSESDHREHAKMVRRRINQSYVEIEQAGKTEAVLQDIHKYQEQTQKNNNKAANVAIDLIA